jgi:hypothetical protein
LTHLFHYNFDEIILIFRHAQVFDVYD